MEGSVKRIGFPGIVFGGQHRFGKKIRQIARLCIRLSFEFGEKTSRAANDRRRNPGELCDALAYDGFALRAGLHCAPSVHQWLGTLHTGACRASVGIYNTETDVEALAAAVGRLLGPDRA